jgi:diamine N-acetyltransferase
MAVLGKRVRLRAIERDDLPAFVRWLNDPEVIQYLQMYWPLSRAQEEQWFEDSLRQQNDRIMAIETVDGLLIGDVGLHRIDWKERDATLGIVLGEKQYWGQGYGQDAIMALLRFAFETLNLHRVHLTVYAYNLRGIRCYEKCGFKKEGCLREAHYHDGRYHDEIMMGILASEFATRERSSADM